MMLATPRIHVACRVDADDRKRSIISCAPPQTEFDFVAWVQGPAVPFGSPCGTISFHLHPTRRVEKLDGVQWSGRDLRSRELRGASLCGANLVGCRLDDADLRGADFWGANLALASLRRADLRGARLVCSSFAGADLRSARLGTGLAFCDLAGAHLACADFGRTRAHPLFAYAASRGYPTFADALQCCAFQASRMMPGPALLAVEAALDSSPDADSEICSISWARGTWVQPLRLPCFERVFRPMRLSRVARRSPWRTKARRIDRGFNGATLSAGGSNT